LNEYYYTILVFKIGAQKHVPVRSTTAGEYHNLSSGMFKITTGSKKLDEILDGGIKPGSITEIIGGFGTGKTQLCLTLAATCQVFYFHVQKQHLIKTYFECVHH
jgi:predicted ATP-dependent serine protease